jgi:hypothetical protein
MIYLLSCELTQLLLFHFEKYKLDSKQHLKGGWIGVYWNNAEFKNYQAHKLSPNIIKAVEQSTLRIWWWSGNSLYYKDKLHSGLDNLEVNPLKKNKGYKKFTLTNLWSWHSFA